MGDVATKACKKCGETKPLSEYYLNRGKPITTCKPCRRAQARKVRVADPEKHRAATRKWVERNPERAKAKVAAWHAANPGYLHGLTPGQYNELLEAQGGACAVCRRPESSVDKRSGKVLRLSVDHDHSCCPGLRSCGKCVRGLLCGNCNRGIGCLGDDADRLRAALAYLGG